MFFEIPPGHAPISNDQLKLLDGEACNRVWFQWFQRLRDNLDSGSVVAATSLPVNVAIHVSIRQHFIRVGDVVTVSGIFQYTNAAIGPATALTVSIPVVSNLAVVEDLAGVGHGLAAGVPEDARVFADFANNAARFEWIAGSVAGNSMWYVFNYRILI